MGSYRDIRDQRIKWKKRRKRDSLVAYPRKPQTLYCVAVRTSLKKSRISIEELRRKEPQNEIERAQAGLTKNSKAVLGRERVCGCFREWLGC